MAEDSDGTGDRFLFRREGARFVPGPRTDGPWRAGAMHGGAPSALVGAVASSALEPGEQVARVQIDLEQPVPVEPLVVSLVRRQVSRRIAHFEIEVTTEDGRRTVGANVLAMRKEVDVAGDRAELEADGPEHFEAVIWDRIYEPGRTMFVRDAVEHRIVRGGFGAPTPTAAWLRLVVPVIEGEVSSGLAQALAVADFGSALSSSGSVGEGLALINADVNLTICREPVGPWFFLAGTGQVGEGGIGVAVTQIADLQGPLGVVTQSQIVRRYVGPPGRS